MRQVAGFFVQFANDPDESSWKCLASWND